MFVRHNNKNGMATTRCLPISVNLNLWHLNFCQRIGVTDHFSSENSGLVKCIFYPSYRAKVCADATTNCRRKYTFLLSFSRALKTSDHYFFPPRKPNFSIFFFDDRNSDATTDPTAIWTSRPPSQQAGSSRIPYIGSMGSMFFLALK